MVGMARIPQWRRGDARESAAHFEGTARMFRCAALTLTFLFANALNVAAQQYVVSVGTTPLADAVSHAAIGREPTVTLWSLSQLPLDLQAYLTLIL